MDKGKLLLFSERCWVLFSRAHHWYRGVKSSVLSIEVGLKNPKSLLIALVLAILATSAQCRYVKQREVTLLELTEPLQVVVARQNVREGDRLRTLRHCPYSIVHRTSS